MQACFLLGPAGSGKTFRCLQEVRAALANDSNDDPLVLLAPKQATFQLERQLLDSNFGLRGHVRALESGDMSPQSEIQGFTRLHILSFERLARFVFEKLNVAPPQLLSDEGRVMVLRALLLRHEKDLKLFRQSARRPGFANQLSQLLRELQQHQITPEKLRSFAQNKNLRAELRDKLTDLALLHENYSDWLAKNKLQDANCLLDFATSALKDPPHNPQSAIRISSLWLDGFAEMTPQELDLLAAILPFCESATLAFCLDESAKKENSWLSIWNGIAKTFQQCRQRIENLPDAKIEIEFLKHNSGKNRFIQNPALQYLEANWQSGSGFLPDHDRQDACPTSNNAIQIVCCVDAESEAIFAAREILKFVRDGNRFRDCAVIVRNLDNYHKPLARIFRRYNIPFFLDRRESVAHHPLAELTRSALRTVAFDWKNDDWLAALKAGFCAVEENEIDALENAALEFGWNGKKWHEPLPDESFERLRKKIFPPFEDFYKALAKLKFQPNGKQLAKMFRKLWENLKVEAVLEKWTASDEQQSAIHSTVLDRMNSLLENLELGFPNQSLSLRDWLPILESGLANLTVGVIPPVLDEVLIGAIDRARNPDLKFTLVLGVNESVFPAMPNVPVILTENDRNELQMPLGPDLREQISRENFYGYLACTRASEKLALTFSRADAEGTVLNPSPFIAQLQQIFHSLEVEEFKNEIEPAEIESVAEIAPLFFATESPELKIQDWEPLREPNPEENLSPQIAEKLYSPILRTSVSRLEEFASCPFRFFVRSGLKAEERKVFELDARERGSFQHEVLKEFHIQATRNGGHWRDLTPAQARDWIGKIAALLTENFSGGLMNETAQSRFAARAMTESLQDFVAVSVAWLREQNQFDPAAAELDFGSKGSPETAWQIDLKDSRKLALTGRIDRVDLCRDESGSAAIVIDYKSSSKKLDVLFVEHGIQLQLLAYLNVLRRWKNPKEVFGVDKLNPAGVFYINLRGQFENGTREEVLAAADESRRAAYRHTGRFDASVLLKLDSRCARDQFNYRLKNDGTLYANSVEALPRDEFEKLLDRVETLLRDFGNAIFSGVANVDPYRKGKQTPCEFCDYRPACRIDPWTHKFRALRSSEKSAAEKL